MLAHRGHSLPLTTRLGLLSEVFRDKSSVSASSLEPLSPRSDLFLFLLTFPTMRLLLALYQLDA